MTEPVLWHIEVSHYNEKVRWALDYKGISHRRRAPIPGVLHPVVALAKSGKPFLPILDLDGRSIHDSSKIIEELERRRPEPPLYPADPDERARALALEEHFDEELGPHIRRVLFHALLPFTDAAVGALTVGCSNATRTIYRVLFPGIRAAMRMDMRIDDASARRSHEKVGAALDRVEAELGPAGYLVGDRFSVADLTAAALLVPLVLPPEFPYLPQIAFPEPVERYRASLLDRPAVRWAAEMYRRHRGRSAEVGS